MNDKCDRCGGPMLALFTSVVCRDDCGRGQSAERAVAHRDMLPGTLVVKGWPPCYVRAWLQDDPRPREAYGALVVGSPVTWDTVLCDRWDPDYSRLGQGVVPSWTATARGNPLARWVEEGKAATLAREKAAQGWVGIAYAIPK